jgi:hypothetical protein
MKGNCWGQDDSDLMRYGQSNSPHKKRHELQHADPLGTSQQRFLWPNWSNWEVLRLLSTSYDSSFLARGSSAYIAGHLKLLSLVSHQLVWATCSSFHLENKMATNNTVPVKVNRKHKLRLNDLLLIFQYLTLQWLYVVQSTKYGMGNYLERTSCSPDPL